MMAHVVPRLPCLFNCRLKIGIRKEVEDKICSLLVERYANQPAGIQISAEDDNIVLHVLD